MFSHKIKFVQYLAKCPCQVEHLIVAFNKKGDDLIPNKTRQNPNSINSLLVKFS